MFRFIFQKFNAFWSADDGVIAIMFAFMAFLILATVSFGIDASFVFNKRDRAQLVADEASLYAITKFRTYIEKGTDRDDAFDQARKDTERYIRGRSELLDGKILGTQIKLEFADASKTQLKAKVNIRGQHDSYLTQAIGMDKFDYDISSEAQVSFETGNFEFIFLVDVSPSMGIGASDSDRQTMQSAINCQFACHEPWTSTVDQAHDAGAVLRLDVVKRALRSLVLQLEDAKNMEMKVALYTFSNTLHTKTGLQTDLSQFKIATNSIGIHREYLKGGGTNFNGVFKEFDQVLKTLKPKKDVKQHVIILTDASSRHNLRSGTTGHLWNQTPNYVRYHDTFNSSWCDPFKTEENRTVHTVLVDPDWGSGISDKYPNAMKDCASNPEFFYRANSASQIDKAFKELFETLMKSVYISS